MGLTRAPKSFLLEANPAKFFLPVNTRGKCVRCYVVGKTLHCHAIENLPRR